MNTLYQHHRRYNLSDFHEMAIHLRMQEERSLLMENHTFMVEINGPQSGIGSRRFSYSDHLAEKMAELEPLMAGGTIDSACPEAVNSTAPPQGRPSMAVRRARSSEPSP